MASENTWNNAGRCADLRRLIEGTHEPLNEGDLPNAIEHWKTCRACQDAFPNAMRVLNRVREMMENEIRDKLAWLTAVW